MQPGLDRRYGSAEALRKRLAARAAIIGKQEDGPLLLVQFGETLKEDGEPLRPVALGEWVDRIGRGLKSLWHLFQRGWTHAPELVKGAVAADDRHPGERRALGRIEFGRVLPDAHVGLLQRVGGVALWQDPNDDPVKPGARLAVERREGGLVAPRNPAEEVREIVPSGRRPVALGVRPRAHSAILGTAKRGCNLVRRAEKRGAGRPPKRPPPPHGPGPDR